MAEIQTDLGVFLKEKRESLTPELLGFSTARRRTPGLRREEVAQRANISVTWYTWLEQGRGGAPSAEVLHRISDALLLSKSEMDYLFLTALGHLPNSKYQLKKNIPPHYQVILDKFNPHPAMIRNLTWDVLAWNHAATKVLTDYAKLSEEERNIMRIFFLKSESKKRNSYWESTAKLIVSAFRSDLARLGENENTQALLNELCERSPEFSSLWKTHNVEELETTVKALEHIEVGKLNLIYSSFAVSGSPELNLIVYTPADESTELKLGALCDEKRNVIS